MVLKCFWFIIQLHRCQVFLSRSFTIPLVLCINIGSSNSIIERILINSFNTCERRSQKLLCFAECVSRCINAFSFLSVCDLKFCHAPLVHFLTNRCKLYDTLPLIENLAKRSYVEDKILYLKINWFCRHLAE